MTVLFSPIFLIAGLLPLHGLIPGMVLVLKSAAVYFGRLGLTNESQLLIPSLGLPLTTKSLAAVTIPKEGIQGWGGGGHICEMPTGVMRLGRYHIPKIEAECTLQRVVVVGWLCNI